MKQDISMQSGLTIGLDLGDRRSDLCVLDPRGQVQARFKAATTPRGLQKAFERYRGALVVLEVGTHSPWVSRCLASSGFEVIVANPRMVRLIAQSNEKSDRFDAEILARLGRVDPALLRPIQHRGEATQRDRALLAVRDGLVRSRSSLVSQARGIAKSLGQRLPRCETESFANRMRREGLASFFPGMEGLVAVIDQLTQRIRDLDREIETQCAERYPETVLLRQVTGVGPITALTDSGRLPTSRYLRLGPSAEKRRPM